VNGLKKKQRVERTLEVWLGLEQAEICLPSIPTVHSDSVSRPSCFKILCLVNPSILHASGSGAWVEEDYSGLLLSTPLNFLRFLCNQTRSEREK
jgi:hypothetical protein